MSEFKLKLGDSVIVQEPLASLTHSLKRSYSAVVVGFYPRFFNVKYKEGYQQSIFYDDANKVTYVRPASEESDTMLRQIYEELISDNID